MHAGSAALYCTSKNSCSGVPLAAYKSPLFLKILLFASSIIFAFVMIDIKRMQEFFLYQEKRLCHMTTMLILLLLYLNDVHLANGSCEFPIAWTGEWYQYGKPVSITVNATFLGERMCIERSEHSYIVYGDNCYYCIIVNDRHENVIQFREGWCNAEQTTLDDMCSNTIKSDDTLYSMFRVNSKPIPCPFSGPSFTFTYDKGFGECAMPISLGEKCTDESKLLLKYQACPDIERSESNTEELQCLAVWNDGRNKYLVGTLKGRSISGAEKTYRKMVHNYVKNIVMKYSKIFLTKLILQKKVHYQSANIYKTNKMILLWHINKKIGILM